MKRIAIILFVCCITSLGATKPPPPIWITWDHPDPSVWFNVYEQDVVLPQPGPVDIGGQPPSSIELVTQKWLTNGWTRIAIVQTRYFRLPQDDSYGVLHCFSVTAVNSAGESAFATK